MGMMKGYVLPIRPGVVMDLQFLHVLKNAFLSVKCLKVQFIHQNAQLS